MSERNPVIVFIESNGVGAVIDWVMPLCKYLQEKKQADVSFVFMKFDRRHIVTLCQSLFYRELLQSFPQESIVDMRYFSAWWGTCLCSLIAPFRGIENRILQKILWRIDEFLWRGISQEKIKRWIQSMGSAPIAIKDGYSYSERSKFAFFYPGLKERMSPIVLLPPGVLSTNFPDMWTEIEFDKNYHGDGKDYFFVEAKESFKHFRSVSTSQIIATGVPKFDPFWMEKCREYMKKNQPAGQKKRINVLVLLKNEKSPIFEDISFSKLFDEILQKARAFSPAHVVVKPHPRQDMILVKHLLAKAAIESWEINHDPILCLSLEADIVIALPTGGVMDAILCGKHVIEYYDYDTLNTILKKRFSEVPKTYFGGLSCLDAQGRLTSVYSARGLVHPAHNPEQLHGLLQRYIKKTDAENQKKIRELFPETGITHIVDILEKMRC